MCIYIYNYKLLRYFIYVSLIFTNPTKSLNIRNHVSDYFHTAKIKVIKRERERLARQRECKRIV